MIIYENDGGGVSIVVPTPEYLLTHTLDQLAAKDVPKGKSYKMIDSSVLPSDRTFRNAWEYHETESIVVNMPKARNIKRDIIRALRKPLLEQLDVQYMRAIEAGNLEAQAVIASKKKALRDLPARPEIQAALTPEALKDLDFVELHPE